MPAWTADYAPDDKDLQQALGDEWLKRESVKQRADAWYTGDIPDVLHIKRNPRTGAAMDNNIKINLYKKRMERRRDFLFKTFPQLDLDDIPAESEAESWLKKCMEWNKAATLWGLTVLNGGFTGQVYMRFFEPRPGRDKYPRSILLSNVITTWQADDVDTALWHSLYYKVGKVNYRQDIVDLQAVGMASSGWGIYEYTKKDDDKTGTWDLTNDTLWDYDLGPVITWQHWPRASSFYGDGEFGDIHLNMAYNRIASLGNAVIRNHAFPKTVVTNAATNALVETAVDGLWSLPKDAQVFNLEMQSDLSAVLNFMETLEEAYNSQGRTVDIEGGPADFTNITNLAIKVAFIPQDDANEILKRQYGGALVEASKRLQMLGGQAYDVDPIVVWKPALPESKVEVAQVAEAESRLQLVSKETLSTQLGLDWQQEQDRMKAEQRLLPSTTPDGNAPTVRGKGLPKDQALNVNPINPEELAAVGAMHRKRVVK